MLFGKNLLTSQDIYISKNQKMKAVVDDKIPYIKGQIEQLVDEVVYLPGSDISADDVRDADILIVRTRTHCDRTLLADSNVKLVVTATIGFDHLDTLYLDAAGIRWTNCPGCNASSVKQYVHNALLATGYLKPGFTAGVVGVGHVGSLVAADLECEGLHVLRCDPPKGEPATLKEIAEQADIITFHTPLTRSGDCPTWHIADETFFSSLKHKPLIINSSRGAVVDNKALIRALDKGLVCDAIIDTWEGEPELNVELLQKAVIATPHIAGYSADGKANATRMSLQAVCEFIGKPFTLDIQPPRLPLGFTYGECKDGPLRLYDPRVDTAQLKAQPECFEYFRGNYPLRREFEK